MQKITRQRALELAQFGLIRLLDEKRKTLDYAKAKYLQEGIAEVEAEYAELVAALQFIETAARQKELL